MDLIVNSTASNSTWSNTTTLTENQTPVFEGNEQDSVDIGENFIEARVGDFLRKYINTFLFIFGICGNVLSIAVLTRKKLRKKNVTPYLVGLEIADTLVLLVVGVSSILAEFLAVNMVSHSWFVCKFYFFMSYVSGHCSSWYLVALTFERCCSIWFQSRARRIFTRNVIKVITGLIPTVISLLNFHFLIGFTTNPQEKIPLFSSVCGPVSRAYAVFYLNAFMTIHFTFGFAIPFTLISTGNALIIIKLFLQRRAMRMRVYPVGAVKDEQTGQTTVLLLTLSLVYLICMLPIYLFLQLRPGFIKRLTSPRQFAIANLCRDIASVMMRVNYCVNFVIYCFSGSIFRSELKRLVLCPPPDFLRRWTTSTAPVDHVRTTQSDF